MKVLKVDYNRGVYFVMDIFQNKSSYDLILDNTLELKSGELNQIYDESLIVYINY